MKVLFALGSEQTSKKVAEKYLEKFGDELEYKNVFYFKALLEEVRNNKTYDRIVISEELEQFELKNVEALDKFIFNNIDNITDEIEDSEIIFICSDRRTKEHDRFVERLFNIGVYNTLIGDERNVSSLCEYIKSPMNKKEAKRHLNINPVVSDGSASVMDDEVEEAQIMSILNYYDGIKGNTEEYLPAFDRISEQYSRNQLRVILNFLPADVKRVILSSEKYSYLANNNDFSNVPNNAVSTTNNKTEKRGLFGILKDNKIRGPFTSKQSTTFEGNNNYGIGKEQTAEKIAEEAAAIKKAEEELKVKEEENRKAEQEALRVLAEKQAMEREQAELREKEQKEKELRRQEEQNNFDMQQKNLNDIKTSSEQKKLEEERKRIEKEKEALEEARRKLKEQTEQLQKTSNAGLSEQYNNIGTISGATGNKLVAVVGANKSGTTFISNALSYKLSSNGIRVGLLDITKDNSLYYIYNQNDKSLRNIALECFNKLNQGIETYIPINKNLKVYTSVPKREDMRKTYKNKTIIDTVTKYNNVVIADADFSTPMEYFEKAHEIYIVQDMDIIRMQETTLFLRALKSKNIDMKKIRIIVNKYVKCMLTPKKIVEGLSYYNDPQMSFVDDLLDSKVEFYVIPFNLENYARYVDCMYKNEIEYKRFTADFQEAILRISNNICSTNSISRPKRRGIFG